MIDILLSSPYMKHYKHKLKDDPRLAPPPPVRLALSGLEHKVNMHVLKTMDIDQSSYQGNTDWIMNVAGQMRLTESLESRKRLAHAGSRYVITKINPSLPVFLFSFPCALEIESTSLSASPRL